MEKEQAALSAKIEANTQEIVHKKAGLEQELSGVDVQIEALRKEMARLEKQRAGLQAGLQECEEDYAR